MVAPFTGAWIEIIDPLAFVSMHYVAPFTGAWIEILHFFGRGPGFNASHPSRVRGLKSNFDLLFAV